MNYSNNLCTQGNYSYNGLNQDVKKINADIISNDKYSNRIFDRDIYLAHQQNNNINNINDFPKMVTLESELSGRNNIMEVDTIFSNRNVYDSSKIPEVQYHDRPNIQYTQLESRKFYEQRHKEFNEKKKQKVKENLNNPNKVEMYSTINDTFDNNWL